MADDVLGDNPPFHESGCPPRVHLCFRDTFYRTVLPRVPALTDKWASRGRKTDLADMDDVL